MNDSECFDISAEEFREYIYGEDRTVFICCPQSLTVDEDFMGRELHRVVSAHGVFYLTPGWVAIRVPEEEEPQLNFNF